MKHEELMSRIDNLISVIDGAYDCVAEHGKSGLASIDNVRRVAQDVKIAAERLNEPDAEDIPGTFACLGCGWEDTGVRSFYETGDGTFGNDPCPRCGGKMRMLPEPEADAEEVDGI